MIENTQAVTAFSLKHESKRLLNIGANYIILGELYENWSYIQDYILFLGEKNLKPKNIIDNILDNAHRIDQKNFIFLTLIGKKLNIIIIGNIQIRMDQKFKIIFLF